MVPKQWLTTTSENETNVKMAAYGPRTLLLSWSDETARQHIFRFISSDGRPIGQEETLSVRSGPHDDYMVFPNGDVAWAYAWDEVNVLKVMRISYCEPTQ